MGGERDPQHRGRGLRGDAGVAEEEERGGAFLGGELQAARAGRPLGHRIAPANLEQQRVFAPRNGSDIVLKQPRSFGQARADAITQLLGRSLGEGHHQDLGRRERARETGIAAVAKHQPHIQRSDRVGLACAGAGLYEPAAVERKTQRIECFRIDFRSIPVRALHVAAPGLLPSLVSTSAASSIGRSSVVASSANSPPACRA